MRLVTNSIAAVLITHLWSEATRRTGGSGVGTNDTPQVAVVGSGVAGLTAAYVLQREADVTLYEADDRLGGHADTHEVDGTDGRLLGVDTGFIVHNKRTYRLLRRLFAELGVATQESDMSMSISCGGCGLEYAGGRGLSGLLPSLRDGRQPALPAHARRGRRFHRRARALLESDDDSQTLREFLAAGGFSPTTSSPTS